MRGNIAVLVSCRTVSGGTNILDLLLDEGMLEGLVDGDAFGGVKHDCPVQQVLQVQHLLPHVLWEPLVPNHVSKQVLCGVDGAHDRHLLLRV